MENSFPINVKTPLAGPALKAVLGFSAGILAFRLFQINPLVLIVMMLTGIIFLFTYTRSERTGSIFALPVMFLSGMLACSVQNEISRPLEVPDKIVNLDVKVEGIITGNTNYFHDNTAFELKCLSVYCEGNFYPVQGILPCTLYNRRIIIDEGSHIIVQGKIKKLPQPFKQKRLRLLQKPVSDNSTYRLMSGYNSPYPVIVEEGRSFFGYLRNSISSLIDRYSFGGYGGLLRAMTIGDRSSLSFKTKEDFSRSGIAHILAVSGLHVGIVLLALNFILSFIPIAKNKKILIILCLLFFYAGLCSFRPPVVRTVIMTTMVMAGMLFERPKNIENALFIALLFILAFDPQSLYGPSLQLSFAAVWVIITFYRPIINSVQKRFALSGFFSPFIKYIISILIVSTLAFTATSPIIAVHFGSLPLMSIIVNVPAIPLTLVIVILGMFSVIFIAFGTIAEPLAALFSSITGISLHMLSKLAEFIAELPYASIDTGRLSPFVGCCFLTWLFVFSRAKGRNGFKKALLYIPFVCLIIFTWSPIVFSGHLGNGQGSVVFFDVGQGDSALIKYGNKRYFLVDTGVYSAAKYVIVPSLENAGIKKLDGVFISHMDTDHIGGLDYILKNIKVENIFCRKSVKDSLESIYGNRITGISAGDSITFNEGGILVLSPLPDSAVFLKYRISGENNNSLLLRFNVCGSQVLFTGDIEEDVQRLMVSWGPSLNSSIMKTPHHGAETLQAAFVKAVNPELAFISCGLNNRYGHPAESTVSILKRNKITVMRTDQDGSVIVLFPELEILSY